MIDGLLDRKPLKSGYRRRQIGPRVADPDGRIALAT